MQLEPVTNFCSVFPEGTLENDDDRADAPDDRFPPRMALYTRIWSAPDLTCSPFLPFRIIRHMAMACPEAFMQAVSTTLCHNYVKPNTAEIPNKLTTSCRNTASAVLFLFLGAEKARFTIKNLERESAHRFLVVEPSLGLEICVTVRGLMYGGVLAGINKNKTFVDLKKEEQTTRRELFIHQYKRQVAEVLRQVHAQAISTLPENATKETLKQTVMDTFASLDFNSWTMAALNKEIWRHQSGKDVHAEQSFIYCISTFCETRDALIHEHICVLEQFFCASTETIRFRLHQSWVGEATLKDNILQRGYDDEGAGSLRYVDLLGFLTSLEARYCQKAFFLPTSQKSCFGFGAEQRSRPKHYFQKHTLYGISLRYLCLPCRPSEATHHLDQLIERHPALKRYFYPNS